MAVNLRKSLKRRLRRWRRALQSRLDTDLSHAAGSEQTKMLLLGALVGAIAGMGAVVFKWLIALFHHLFFDGGERVLGALGPYYVVVLPAVGLIIVSAIVRRTAPEAKGHGVPEIMEAVALHGGFIRARVAVIKSLSSALCIGSGGSVGSEGPIAQIGAGMGSTLGLLLKLPESGLRTLVASGAAGGIAATFNAPLAGAFFALEVVLSDWKAEAFAPAVVAAVMASVVGHAFLGDAPVLAVPQYSVSAFGQLPMFLVLGVATGLVGAAFTRLLYMIEDLFEAIPIPWWALSIVGGLVVGAIGLYDRELFGVGYGAITSAITATHYTVVALLVMMVLKIITTSTTIAAGGSGGVFAPSLFLGSMVGGVIGYLNQYLMPHSSVSPGAFALAGMGALFSATSHAPITATLIVFELTGDYRMILPLMLSCGVGVITARVACRFSIYNLKLVRRGVHITLAQDTRLLSEIKVSEAMTTDLITVDPQTTVAEVAQLLEHTKHHGFPLVDGAGKLHGIVTIGDVYRAGAKAQGQPVTDIASHALLVVNPGETLNDALVKLGTRNVGRLPVVDPDDPEKLVGLITRKNIIAAYHRRLDASHTHLDDTLDEEQFP
jgi:CIC family chloride channel protein